MKMITLFLNKLPCWLLNMGTPTCKALLSFYTEVYFSFFLICQVSMTVAIFINCSGFVASSDHYCKLTFVRYFAIKYEWMLNWINPLAKFLVLINPV